MLSQATFLYLLTFSIVELTALSKDRGDIDVSSGYTHGYTDEDMSASNQVFSTFEKASVRNKVRLSTAIKPIPVRDLKCLLSAEHYCSKEMKETKETILEAIRSDCKSCSTAQKIGAGKVIAAMMVHDPEAWKLFLTRYKEFNTTERILE